MAPIGVGILGLSAKPDSWAFKAHIPRLRDSSNFEIVGLCNSSLASTKEAIKAHGLPSSTKAYDSAEKLAADQDVDLVVISTRVDTHYSLAKAAMHSGAKAIYVEWPLASNVEQARELVSLAKEKNVKTIIGLQGRVQPAILKVKELIGSGKLGTVQSINVQSTLGVYDQTNIMSEPYSYFFDRAIGGNPLTIHGGHTLDSVLFAHQGELQKGYTTLLGNNRPKMKIKASDGTVSGEVHPKTTPDQILLLGHLTSPPAPLTVHLRAGVPFPGKDGFTWRVEGSRACLLLEASGRSIHIGFPTKISIHDYETKDVEVIEMDNGFEGLGMPAATIGRLYEAYAKGGEHGTWEDAFKNHVLIDGFYDGEMV